VVGAGCDLDSPCAGVGLLGSNVALLILGWDAVVETAGEVLGFESTLLFATWSFEIPKAGDDGTCPFSVVVDELLETLCCGDGATLSTSPFCKSMPMLFLGLEMEMAVFSSIYSSGLLSIEAGVESASPRVKLVLSCSCGGDGGGGAKGLTNKVISTG